MAVAQTTLNGAINGAVTSLVVRDVLGFASTAETSDLVQIDTEYILVTTGMGTVNWTVVTRGYAGSTAAAHSDGATVTRLERGYTDATRLKTMVKSTSVDDAYLQTVADQANGWLNAEVGNFYGPSTDTVRTFDVPYDCNELPIADGIRSFTTVEIKLRSSDAAFQTVTNGDVVARPLAWERLDGLEADRLVFLDWPIGSYRYFYAGIGTARVTGTFGPAAPPNALRRIADTVGVWLYQSRAAGAGGIIGSLDAGELVVNRVLTPLDLRTIKLYRGVNPSLYAMPAS